MTRLRDELATHNERVKLGVSFINALSIGLIGFAVLRPLTDPDVSMSTQTGVWGLVGLALHGLAHYILGMLRKEAANDRL